MYQADGVRLLCTRDFMFGPALLQKMALRKELPMKLPPQQKH
jgi:hypothetical protein